MTAREIAVRGHTGQLRKHLTDEYIVHPARVAAEAAQHGFGAYAIDAAWLHDVIEDSDWTYDRLRLEGIATRTVVLVLLLTKWWKRSWPNAAIYKAMYYQAIALDPDATDLKLLDRADNFADCIRVAAAQPAFVRRYVQESMVDMAPLLTASTRPSVVAHYMDRLMAVTRQLAP